MKMKTIARKPKPGTRLAKIVRQGVITVVNTRIVLAIEKRSPHGTTVVYTRKRPNRPCRCSLSEWRRWAKGARRPALSAIGNAKHPPGWTNDAGHVFFAPPMFTRRLHGI